MASHADSANQHFDEIKHLCDNGGSADLAKYHLHQFEKHLAKSDSGAVLKSRHEEAIRMVEEMKRSKNKPD